MRKVYCVKCNKEMDAHLYFLDFEAAIKRLEDCTNKLISKIAIYLFINNFYCYTCIVNTIIDIEKIKEEFENGKNDEKEN